MKLGLLTAAFPGKTLDEVAGWAGANGFEMLELACWPAGKATRRYAGVTTLDVTNLGQKEADEVKAIMEQNNLQISSLAYYPNPMHPDEEHRSVVIAVSYTHLDVYKRQVYGDNFLLYVYVFSSSQLSLYG